MAVFSIGEAVEDGLALYYDFEKISGDAVPDKSGNGNDGTIIGTLEQVEGKYGDGLMFDFNAANYVDAGEPSFGGLNDSGSIEAWIKPEGDMTILSVIRKDHDFNMFVWGGTACVEWFNGPNLFGIVPGVTNLEESEWYHVVGTWDGETLKLYLDGEFEKEVSAGANFGRTGPHSLYIGLAKVYAQPFRGVIDEVAMYDRPLTEDEIQQDMEGAILSVEASGKLATTWGNLKKEK
jgi:hypothetical protein